MLKINLINEYDNTLRLYRSTITKVMKTAYKLMAIQEKLIINVILVGDERMREINLLYRQIDKTTDVISFENDDSIDEMGDVFISIDKAKSQAIEYGHPFSRELGFLSAHGFLHCAGYDHLNQPDETEMFSLQETILTHCKLKR